MNQRIVNELRKDSKICSYFYVDVMENHIKFVKGLLNTLFGVMTYDNFNILILKPLIKNTDI